jgi:hypothetical protein
MCDGGCGETTREEKEDRLTVEVQCRKRSGQFDENMHDTEKNRKNVF